jgi:hypothetical protein
MSLLSPLGSNGRSIPLRVILERPKIIKDKLCMCVTQLTESREWGDISSKCYYCVMLYRVHYTKKHQPLLEIGRAKTCGKHYTVAQWLARLLVRFESGRAPWGDSSMSQSDEAKVEVFRIVRELREKNNTTTEKIPENIHYKKQRRHILHPS